jgi:hypothetical protein
MLDTVGPELQVVNTSETPISLEANGTVVLTPHQGQQATDGLLPINFSALAKVATAHYSGFCRFCRQVVSTFIYIYIYAPPHRALDPWLVAVLQLFFFLPPGSAFGNSVCFCVLVLTRKREK